MLRARWILLAAALLAAFLCLFVRLQPAATSTVYRSADAVAVRTSRIYVTPLARGQVCRTALAADALVFEAPVTLRLATGDDVVLDTHLEYEPPDRVPASWSDSDWCSALATRVTLAAASWASSQSLEALLADRREAGHAAADSVNRLLSADGLKIRESRATVILPNGVDRLRAVDEVRKLSHRARPVIFVGLDGADWELLDDYMHAGAMPVLSRLVAEGSSGVLETEHPPLSPLIWTTMMTGVSPLEHEILDFTRFNPYTHDREPITSDERRVPAIWNMLNAAGKSAAQFGLWATYAAEPVHGVNVSDRLFTFLFTEKSVPPGAVYPDSRAAWARAQLDAAEHAVTAERVRAYLPSLTDADYAAAVSSTNPYGEPASALRRILVETEVYRRLATDYLARGPLPDVSIVYLQGTDTVGHVFAPYAPPQQPQVSADDYQRYNAVPQRYFSEVDALLGEFVRLAKARNAVLVLASDHGFRWKEGRPVALSSFAAASAAKWHRNEGIFVVWNNGAPSPGHSQRAGVRQLCATLASLAGLPAAAGTETTPFPGVAPATTSIDYRRFFQRAAAPPAPASGTASSEDIAKLKALGYIGSNESARSATATGGETKSGAAYNNAGLILRQQKNVDAAIASFEKALAIDPKLASAQWNLSETLFDSKKDLDRSDSLLVQATGNGLPEGTRFVIERAIGYNRSGAKSRLLPLLDGAVSARPQDAELLLFRGRFRLDQHDCAGALGDFDRAVGARPDAIGFASRGLAQMCLGDDAAARVSFERSLALDPNQPMLRQFVGR